ncbi:5-formyltetrahydrofolate cyclo-ligase [Candidatus Formimonas warabiya]|uniref:5-formyltetrahydrofolate cyclo-ligase n=1 Tax=Formimonas warabiya TaxID=1761012 RepID=A0A3G1KTT0_FORW1|nr:5-formyltetrahydrofolate cyclo-ligase [Candidatus Formimonas warabiya]ATW25565.1 5-formyltetrahydrofolate cyclo-ligase [Candidatus Formimonas warabiya]
MKKEIRRKILQARLALSNEEVEKKSKIVCEKILGLPDIAKARTVMAYLPFRKEVSMVSLFGAFWAEGKRVIIPVCDACRTALIPSELKSIEEDLQPGTWGILEPKPEKLRPVGPGGIDFVIVPGVAFDLSCNRLGYGVGYYDRFLPQLKENTPKIAVAFELQMVEALIPDQYDIPMDAVFTEEKEYYRQR